MTIEFSLPDIGEGLHEAEIVRWMVSEGQEVSRDQPFVEIMTDKSSVEMPAPAAGVVARLVPAEGDLVKVGDLLIVIDEHDAEAGGPPAITSPAVASDPSPALALSTAPRPPPQGARRPKAAPSTRRLAAELGVDLTSVTGNGPGGRILADDVRSAVAGPGPGPGLAPTAGPGQVPTPRPGPAPAPAAAIGALADPGPAAVGWMEPGVHPLRGIRRATARAMDRSWSTIPHISASQEIDATPLLDARRELRDTQSRGRGAASADDAAGPLDAAAPITPLALVVMAVARALRRYPMMNAVIDLDGETITVPDRVDIGIAVATDRGLVVPVLADADRLGVEAVAAEIRRLSTAARDRSIQAGELSGGTHTITNYGSAGGHLAAPIIRPGESAITGLGAIADRPMVIDGEVVARPTLPVVVCSDHRLIDGDVMSAFHLDVCQTLSAPIGLLL